MTPSRTGVVHKNTNSSVQPAVNSFCGPIETRSICLIESNFVILCGTALRNSPPMSL